MACKYVRIAGNRRQVGVALGKLARPLMAVAEGQLPALTTSNRVIGQAMIALAGMPAPPAVVECAQINRLARGPSGR